MRTPLAIALLLATLSFGASAQDRTIDGRAVPEGQAAAVQDRCTELQLQQGTTGTQEPETSMDKTTTEQLKPDAGAATEFDLNSITLEQCIAGGFLEQPANASP